jgi:excisionase family DNA binding protein
MSSYMTTADIAELLRCSTDHVRRLVHDGRLPAKRVRPTGRLLFDPADVERALRDARPLATTDDEE